MLKDFLTFNFKSDLPKKALEIATMFVVISGFYTAGVLYKLPTGIVELGGSSIVRSTLADAGLQLAFATILGRVLVLMSFPIFFELARVLIQGLLILRKILNSRAVLRFFCRIIQWLDRIYVIVFAYVSISSYLATFCIFAYFCTGSVLGAFGLLFFSAFPLYFELFNQDLKKDNLRIRMRKRYSRVANLSNLRFSLISAALLFSFLSGSARIQTYIDTREAVTAEKVPNGFVLLSATIYGLILVEKSAKDESDREREWLIVSRLPDFIGFTD